MPTPIKGDLREGDSMEIGVSACIKIDGDENWVSFKATSKVGPGEGAGDAHERVLSYVQESFETTVTRVVAQIRGMGE
jgi:hypothetical protein